jgi:hypothetical protein
MPILLSVYTSRMPCDHAIQKTPQHTVSPTHPTPPHTHTRARPAPARDPRSCNKMTPIPNSRARARVPHVTSTPHTVKKRVCAVAIDLSFVRSFERASQSCVAEYRRAVHAIGASIRSIRSIASAKYLTSRTARATRDAGVGRSANHDQDDRATTPTGRAWKKRARPRPGADADVASSVAREKIHPR